MIPKDRGEGDTEIDAAEIPKMKHPRMGVHGRRLMDTGLG
jgi:hypothetical protein